MLITRSRGRQREYESRELGEVERERGEEGGGETGEGKKKEEEIGSQRLSERAAPNPEDHENAMHFN